MIAHIDYPNIEFDPAISYYDWDQTYDIIYRSPHYPKGFDNLINEIGLPVWGAFDRFDFLHIPYAQDYAQKLANLLKNYAHCPFNSVQERERRAYFPTNSNLESYLNAGAELLTGVTIPSFASRLVRKHDPTEIKLITIPSGKVILSWLFYDTQALPNGVENCPTYNKAWEIFNFDEPTVIDLNQLFRDKQLEDWSTNLFVVNSLVCSVRSQLGEWINFIPIEITEYYYLYADIDTYFVYLQLQLDNYFDFVYENYFEAFWVIASGNSATLKIDYWDQPFPTFVTVANKGYSDLGLIYPQDCFRKSEYLQRIELTTSINDSFPTTTLPKPTLIFGQFPQYLQNHFIVRYANNRTIASDLVKLNSGFEPLPSSSRGLLLEDSTVWGEFNNTSNLFNHSLLSDTVIKAFSETNALTYPITNLLITDGVTWLEKYINQDPLTVGLKHHIPPFNDVNGLLDQPIPVIRLRVFFGVNDNPSDYPLGQKRSFLKSFGFLAPSYPTMGTGYGQTYFLKNIKYQHYAKDLLYIFDEIKDPNDLSRTVGLLHQKCDFELTSEFTYAQGNLVDYFINIDRYYTESRAEYTQAGFTNQFLSVGEQLEPLIKEITIALDFNLLSESEFNSLYEYNLVPLIDYAQNIKTQAENLINSMPDSLRVKETLELAKQTANLLGTHEYPDLTTPLYGNIARKLDLNCKAQGIAINNNGTSQTVQSTRYFKEGETLPLGWYPFQMNMTNGFSLNSRVPNPIDKETISIEQQQVGILYDVISNRIETNPDTGEQKIVNGGYVACNNFPQYLRTMQDDFDKILGGQYLGAGFINRDNTTFVYEGLAGLLHEMFAKIHKEERQTSETHLATGVNQQMIKELMRGIGLPVSSKAFRYTVQTSNPQQDQIDPLTSSIGNVPVYYSGYAEGTPTLVDLFISTIAQLGLQNASQFTLKQEQQENLKKEVNK